MDSSGLLWACIVLACHITELPWSLIVSSHQRLSNYSFTTRSSSSLQDVSGELAEVLHPAPSLSVTHKKTLAVWTLFVLTGPLETRLGNSGGGLSEGLVPHLHIGLSIILSRKGLFLLLNLGQFNHTLKHFSGCGNVAHSQSWTGCSFI